MNELYLNFLKNSQQVGFGLWGQLFVFALKKKKGGRSRYMEKIDRMLIIVELGDVEVQCNVFYFCDQYTQVYFHNLKKGDMGCILN